MFCQRVGLLTQHTLIYYYTPIWLLWFNVVIDDYCGELNLGSNTNVEYKGDNRRLGDKAEITCANGYEHPQRSSRVFTATCIADTYADGAWSQTPKECQRAFQMIYSLALCGSLLYHFNHWSTPLSVQIDKLTDYCCHWCEKYQRPNNNLNWVLFRSASR